MTVEELTKYILAAHANRAKVKGRRAKGEPVSEGMAPEYLPALIGFVYNEFLEIYLQTLPGDERLAEEYMGATPERLILESLFTLFLGHFDEGEVRELFAEFGPKPPRGSFVTGFVPCPGQICWKKFRTQTLRVSSLAIVGGAACRAMMVPLKNRRR
jgi:hypothetical protein